MHLPAPQSISKIAYPKAAFTVLLAIYGVLCARSVEEGSFLDRVDLIAHEAGHLLFGYFGEFLMVVGGTLGQLLVTAGIGAYFVKRREFYAAAVMLFWLGQNFFNISVYVKDAAAMELPLVNIGGGDGIHDWNYLLLKFNILAWDQTVGSLVFAVGLLLMVLSIAACSFYSWERAEEDPSTDVTT
jgi:hypothetical protein